jgi:nitrite reductase/ring-hydroxylating ferredoxin subunit
MTDRPAARDISTVPGGPARGARLARLDEIADNGSQVFTFTDGDKRFEMFLHRLGDRVVAYENSCPHLYLPLDWQRGKFLSAAGDSFICSSHGARFRPDDGFCVAGPCAGAWLRPVAIQLRDGEIFVA